MTVRQPVEVRRPPNDDEISLLCYLAIGVIANQVGGGEEACQAARDVLGDFADEGRVGVDWTATDCWLVAAGNPLVHATREWLTLTAINARMTCEE
jgi:hypothetical protein